MCIIFQWATVCVHLPHIALRTVCSSLVAELKRLHQHVAGLPVASAIQDRLACMLLPGPHDQHSTSPASAATGGGAMGGSVDRAMMYSEAARRDTFSRWPHMKYK